MKVHPLSNVRVNRPNTMPAPWSQPVLTEDGWASTDGIGTITADHPGALYDAARVMASDSQFHLILSRKDRHE